MGKYIIPPCGILASGQQGGRVRMSTGAEGQSESVGRVLSCSSCFAMDSDGGFIKGILRGVRCTLFTSTAPLLDHSCTVLKSSIHL